MGWGVRRCNKAFEWAWGGSTRDDNCDWFVVGGKRRVVEVPVDFGEDIHF